MKKMIGSTIILLNGAAGSSGTWPNHAAAKINHSLHKSQ